MINNKCSESGKLSYAAIGYLSETDSAALLIHLEQCKTCRQIQEVISRSGKTLKGFDKNIFPEWEGSVVGQKTDN